MNHSWRMVIAVSSLGLLGLLPTRARAWTEARVESARADVTIDAAGRSDVKLTLRLHVQRGWLSSLSLAGFDAGIEFSETDPPSLRPLESEMPIYRPTVRATGGRVRLAFERRAAPRRGSYRVMLRYRVALALDSERHEVQFTLPGFEAGLDGVELVFHLPAGSRISPESLPEATTQVRIAREGNQTRLTLRRAHVPRTVPWVVSLRLPGSAPVTAERTFRAPTPAPTETGTRRAPYAFALLFIVIGLIRRRRFAARVSSLGLKPAPLLPSLPALARDAALVIASLGYARASEHEPLAALVFLTFAMLVQIERLPRVLRPARPGAFGPLTASDEAATLGLRMRVLGAVDRCLDASRWVGLATLGLLLVGVMWFSGLEPSSPTLAASVPFAALWFVPTFFSGHARTLPPTLVERIAWAKTQAAALTDADLSVDVVLHRATDGRAQDARLELGLPSPALGLLRLQLLLASNPGLASVEVNVCALVVVRPGSSADRRLEVGYPELIPWTCSERRAYLFPIDGQVLPAITSLGKCLTRDTTPVRAASMHAA